MIPNGGRSWRAARCRAGIFLAAALTAMGPARAGAQCAFGNLKWNTDGTRIQFDITCGGETRGASVDVASGALRIEDARVLEPVQCSRRGSIVFRDALGILECAAQGLEPARLVVPAPDNGPWFVRAYGEDAAGSLIAWLYDREQARHVFLTLGRDAGAVRGDAQPSGPEALRSWAARQQGTRFARAGNRFNHTVCAQFRGRNERACVEPQTGAQDQSFRLTLGRPGAVAEWAAHVWPSGWSMAPDSAAVLVGLLESDAKALRCGLWIVGPERAKCAAQSAGAQGPVLGTESWVQWTDATHAWWADAAGALWTVDREAWSASARLVPAGAARAAAVLPPVAGAVSPAVTGPRGVRAWVRAVPGPRGVDCELWTDPGSGPRRVVAALGPGIAD